MSPETEPGPAIRAVPEAVDLTFSQTAVDLTDSLEEEKPAGPTVASTDAKAVDLTEESSGESSPASPVAKSAPASPESESRALPKSSPAA